MDNLEKLRLSNPQLHIYSVNDPEFSRYGAVITADTGSICEKTEAAADFPAEGSKYVPALDAIDVSPEADKIREIYCGGLDEQIGLCWGHSNTLNALEWHTCNEFNIAVRELVLLLAKREDMDADGRLDSSRIKAFYLAKGEMVEVYSDTLHFCPCEVSSETGFSCIVGLQRGTNLPLAEEDRKNMLWAKNKWLIAHEANTSLVARGAFSGIYGENWKINPID